MRVFKTRWFARWAEKEGVTDAALLDAAGEMNRGLIDASLGGQVFKKRVGIDGRGKSGGLRTLLAFRVGDRAFFVFGFAKNVRAQCERKGTASVEVDGIGVVGFRRSGVAQGSARRRVI